MKMYLIKGADVYAPEHIGTKDILVCAGKIVKIADELPAEEAYGVENVSGEGKILFPGLIDTHVHILGGGGEGGATTRTPEIKLTDITRAGVTTVCGLLGTDGCTRTMTNLIAKTRALNEEGITAYCYTGSYQIPVRTFTGSIMDDITLIEQCIGCGEIALADHRSSQPTQEQFSNIVAQTRVGGMLGKKAGLVNIHMGSGKKKLQYEKYVLEETEIPASNMLPTHINRSKALFADGLDYATRLGGYIDLTTSYDPDNLTPDEVKASTGLKLALDAGVPEDHITFSSDGQGSMPKFAPDGTYLGLGVGDVTSLYREMKDAVLKDGVPLYNALRAVTLNPALLLKNENKGRIKEGCDADMVLADPSSLAIDSVIAKGEFMIKNGDVIKKGTFEI